VRERNKKRNRECNIQRKNEKERERVCVCVRESVVCVWCERGKQKKKQRV